MTTTPFRDAAAAVVGVPARTQTYRNLLYLLLSFPLGLAYFVALSVGFSAGVGLALTVLGVPLVLATLAGATVLARVEAELANRLLGTEIPTEMTFGSGGVVDAVKRLVTDPGTWLDVVYLGVKFVLGVVSFTALVSLLSASVSLLAAPLTYSSAYTVGLHVGTVSVGPFESGRLVVDTFPEAVGAAVAGLALALASLHALNALARVSAKIAETLLGEHDVEASAVAAPDRN
ncbi:sensor domain-containing protein [Halorussus halobius]|uniref:sensor domain-containing protein n=1 Tax=Halorussus halobius TaxID=1710537 RepID=UPI001FCE8247|nr:sensor domain-containing protein [Halorussus halobius]